MWEKSAMIVKRYMCIKMEESHEIKYLGDILHENGKSKATVLQRITRGYSIAGQILASSSRESQNRSWPCATASLAHQWNSI